MAGIAKGIESVAKGIFGDPKAERAKKKALEQQAADRQRLLEEKQAEEDKIKAEEEAKSKLRAAKKMNVGKKSTGRRGTILSDGMAEQSGDIKTLLGS